MSDSSQAQSTSTPLFQMKHTANRIKADSYHECSAKLNEGVDDVFQAAARAAIQRRRNSRIVSSIKTNCALL